MIALGPLRVVESLTGALPNVKGFVNPIGLGRATRDARFAAFGAPPAGLDTRRAGEAMTGSMLRLSGQRRSAR
jgi:hypothetical protein